MVGRNSRGDAALVLPRRHGPLLLVSRRQGQSELASCGRRGQGGGHRRLRFVLGALSPHVLLLHPEKRGRSRVSAAGTAGRGGAESAREGPPVSVAQAGRRPMRSADRASRRIPSSRNRKPQALGKNL